MSKRWVTLASIFVLLSNGVDAQQPKKTFHKTFQDLNYVPCEGMGATASGTVEVTIEYHNDPGLPALPAVNCPDYACEVRTGGSHPAAPAVPPSYSIDKMFVDVSYLHDSEITGTALFPSSSVRAAIPAVRGEIDRPVILVKPWYTTIGPPGSSTNALVLPPADPKREFPRLPRDAQRSQTLDIGKPITLDLSIRFPGDGGNCLASFHQTFTLE